MVRQGRIDRDKKYNAARTSSRVENRRQVGRASWSVVRLRGDRKSEETESMIGDPELAPITAQDVFTALVFAGSRCSVPAVFFFSFSLLFWFFSSSSFHKPKTTDSNHRWRVTFFYNGVHCAGDSDVCVESIIPLLKPSSRGLLFPMAPWCGDDLTDGTLRC